MSKNVYYNASRAEILKRLKCIQDENIVDFFEESDSFMLALYIAYFTLAEEILIERDTHNPDINTRFKSHIDMSRLDELFNDPSLIKIYDKEKDGNSREWFISTLRNGIMHKGPEVDYHEKKVHVTNDGELNKLDCDVFFEWFRKFICDDFLLHSTIDEYNYTSFITPYLNPNQTTGINTFDDIRNFIDNELLAYSINIKHNSGDEITREEFLEFCRNKEVTFWRYLFSSSELSEEEKNVLKNYELLVTSAIGTPKNISAHEYRRLFNYTFYVAWFETDFKKNYPGYDVNINEFNRLNPNYSMVVNGLSRSDVEKRMFGSYRKTQKFFREFHPAIQRIEISSCLSRLINEDKVDYITHMQYLFSIYDMHKGCGKNEYGLEDFIRKINSYRRSNSHEIENQYAQEIHDRLSQKGVVHSYVKQITEYVVRCRNAKDDLVFKRCRELCDKFDDPMKDEYFSYICTVLSNEFPEFYQEESERRKDCGVYSDQVQEIYNENDLYRLCNAMYVFKEEKDDILVALLYALGINTYVVNKEGTFRDELKPEDYDFMDSLDIVGYSKDRVVELEQLRGSRKDSYSHLKGITNMLSNVDKALQNDPNNERLKGLKSDAMNNIARYSSEIAGYQNIIDSIDVAEFSGIKMASLNNSQCADRIRNCFAHGGRIFVDSKKPGGEIRLVLTDYDENGNLSGVVQTNLDSLIKFFSHKTFYNAMNQEATLSEEETTPPILEPSAGELSEEEIRVGRAR